MGSEVDSGSSSLLHDSPSLMYVTIWGMGCLSGLLAGVLASTIPGVWFNLPTEVWGFLVVWAASTAYYSYRRVPSGVVASGLYVSAVFLALLPITTYVPVVVASQSGQAIDASVLLDATVDFLQWGVLAGLLAALAVFLSRRLTRRADRLYRRRATRRLREHE